VLAADLKPYRDELIISTKAGCRAWPGPYGDLGSRKHLLASLDHSLKRMGLEYVDIFYSHRPDPNTPLEETMSALAQAVRQGKALYVGLSNYGATQTRTAAKILRDLGTPCLIHQPDYSLFNRQVEGDLQAAWKENGIGAIAYTPLAQGLLTDKYLGGIPDGSRASKAHSFLKKERISEDQLAKIRRLNEIALARGQSLAQMALVWVLREGSGITSALIGASRVSQLEENIRALEKMTFSAEELTAIDDILKGQVDLFAPEGKTDSRQLTRSAAKS